MEGCVRWWGGRSEYDEAFGNRSGGLDFEGGKLNLDMGKTDYWRYMQD